MRSHDGDARVSKASGTGAADSSPLIIDFEENRFLPALYGDHDRHLARIEQALDVSLSSRGNRVAVTGNPESCRLTDLVLRELYRRLETGKHVTEGEVDGALRMVQNGLEANVAGGGGIQINTYKHVIAARSPAQEEYLRRMFDHEMVFALGPAGTGKTYLAVAVAVSMLREGAIERIILSRPAVEAGERLGFLPGDIREKVDPYMRPLYDALYDMLPGKQAAKRLESGEIEVAPLAFMRGRTLANSFIILDEAQNTTPVQMKMFLTRLGQNSRMVITGDPSQIDLSRGARSGLIDAVEVLAAEDAVARVEFTDVDVMRHGLVTRIVRAYNAHDKDSKTTETKGAGR